MFPTRRSRPTLTVPETGSSSPSNTWSNELFPTPFLPKIATRSPKSTLSVSGTLQPLGMITQSSSKLESTPQRGTLSRLIFSGDRSCTFSTRSMFSIFLVTTADFLPDLEARSRKKSRCSFWNTSHTQHCQFHLVLVLRVISKRSSCTVSQPSFFQNKTQKQLHCRPG